MKFLIGLKLLGHLGNYPSPEPVCARRVVRMVCQEINRYSHRYLPARSRAAGAKPLRFKTGLSVGHYRSEDIRGDRFGGHSRLTDKLREGMHNSLVQVLDNPVIRSLDVNGHVSQRSGVTASKSGQRDGLETVFTCPCERAHDIR